MNNLKKRDKVLEMLATCRLVHVCVNPAVPGIMLPADLSNHSQVTLAIGLDCAMVVPINDLVVDLTSISGTLSFNRRPIFVFLPWDSVFDVSYAGESQGWSFIKRPEKKEAVPAKAAVKRPNHLRLVK